MTRTAEQFGATADDWQQHEETVAAMPTPQVNAFPTAAALEEAFRLYGTAPTEPTHDLGAVATACSMPPMVASPER